MIAHSSAQTGMASGYLRRLCKHLSRLAGTSHGDIAAGPDCCHWDPLAGGDLLALAFTADAVRELADLQRITGAGLEQLDRDDVSPVPEVPSQENGMDAGR